MADTRGIAARHGAALSRPEAATHCNTLQHAATHYKTLQHTATHCNTLETLPPDPMNHAKIFKGWSPRHGPSELVPQWLKTFSPEHFVHVEMKKPNRLSNKTGTA